MKSKIKITGIGAFAAGALIVVGAFAYLEVSAAKGTSYAPVAITEDFETTMVRMKAGKEEVMARQMTLLRERYDLSDRPARGVTMSRGKAVQEGVRAKVADGVTWEELAAMTPEEIRKKGLFPKGFLPLPHPNHNEGNGFSAVRDR